MPAPGGAAAHVALQRDPDLVGGDAPCHEGLGGEAHHDVRSADECHGLARREPGGLDERRDDSDLPVPVAVRPVGSDGHLDPRAPPRCKLGLVQHVGGAAGTGQQHDPAVPGPVSERGEHHRAQRREADPARDDHDVVPGRGGHIPARAERAAHADEVARPRGVQRASDRSDCAQGVLQAAGMPVDRFGDSTERLPGLT